MKKWWEYYPEGVVISLRLYYWQLSKEQELYDHMGNYYGRNY